MNRKAGQIWKQTFTYKGLWYTWFTLMTTGHTEKCWKLINIIQKTFVYHLPDCMGVAISKQQHGWCPVFRTAWWGEIQKILLVQTTEIKPAFEVKGQRCWCYKHGSEVWSFKGSAQYPKVSIFISTPEESQHFPVRSSAVLIWCCIHFFSPWRSWGRIQYWTIFVWPKELGFNQMRMQPPYGGHNMSLLHQNWKRVSRISMSAHIHPQPRGLMG